MRVATDVGGTFTDLVMCPVDSSTGCMGTARVVKAHTTPLSFEQGVFDALLKTSVSPEEFDFFAHGSTVVINAITERRGVKTALITTNGFRDVLEIGRANRPDLFNFRYRKPPPFVDRYLRVELTERTTFDGLVLKDVDLTPLPGLIEFFKAEGVEAIAICFLHAYANPSNEEKVAQAIRAAWSDVAVLASHEISREWREYERTSTAVLSAYVYPTASAYLEALQAGLESSGYRGSPFVMQSNGGITTIEQAKANPITMIESGPASGIFAASYVGKAIGVTNLIALDIGGTTAKCALIEDGNFKVVTEYHVERNRRSPGYPIQTPVTEIVEIGNGGGSIAWADAGGKLHVGPQSAGADPGPAAYGRGGTRPTTTDANLILGRIDSRQFVGGEVDPDWQAVNAAFTPLCEKLRCSREELARGIIRVANANMTNALRLVSTSKGYDPREFALMAFGGGGPMHAVALAEELQIPKVIIPINSSVFSAWGMLLTDLRRDYVMTSLAAFDAATMPKIAELFDSMETEARANSDRDVSFEYFVDLRYQGQEHTVKTAMQRTGDGQFDGDATIALFGALYERLYTHRLDRRVQVVNCHLVAKTSVPKPTFARREPSNRTSDEIVIGERRVDFDKHGIHSARIYDGILMEPGMTLLGPAVIQEPSTTIVISPGHRASMDDLGNYHIDLRF